MTRTATKQVIEKAYQKAGTQGAEYGLTFLTDSQWVVAHTSDATRKYRVITLEGFEYCTCKAWEIDGFCKHIALCLESEHYEELAAQYERPIDCAEIDAFAPVIAAPRNLFPVVTITQYHAAMNLSDLTRDELSGLHSEYDRLFKHTI